MNPPVFVRDLQESVRIGAFEFGQLTVIQHRFHNRVVRAQFFQNVRVRGIPRFRLFPMRKFQHLKENIPQLLGRVDVELRHARKHIDLLLQSGGKFAELFAVGGNACAVNAEADRLHIRQNRRERFFNVGEQIGLPAFFKVFRKFFPQREKDRHARAFLRQKHTEIVLYQHRQVVIPLGGIRKVSRKHQIPDGQIPQSLKARILIKRFGIVADQSLSRQCGDKRPERLGQAKNGLRVSGQINSFRSAIKRNGGNVLQCRRNGFCVRVGHRNGCDRGGNRGGFRLRCLRRYIGDIQTEPLDKARKFQPQEQFPQLGAILPRRFESVKRHSERHGAADTCERLREIRALPPFGQLPQNRRRFLCGRQCFVHAVKASVGRNQLERGLFPDARHARNVVRTVPHQRLDIHELPGVYAVFLAECGAVGVNRIGIGGKQNVRVVADQLKRIAIPRHQAAGNLRPVAHRADRAQNIVRFVALAFQHMKAHCGKQFLCNRQLLRQLFRHGTSARLVGVVHPMTESRRFEIERHGKPVRTGRVNLLPNHVDQPVKRVGRKAVLGRERANSVKRAVEDAVSVND